MRADVMELFDSLSTPPIPERLQRRTREIAWDHVRSREILPLSAGDPLGSFVIEETLGSGGQAVVYFARHIETHRAVAIKVPRRGVGDRLLRVARLAAKIDHPRIVRVEEVQPDASPPYMVMERCEGGSLDSLMDKHPFGLPIKRVAEIARGILEALLFAHDEGVVHRDVKPGNVLFDANGRAKLGDLGIGTTSHATGVSQSFDMTRTGMTRFVGTPHYMAPEQEDPTILGGARIDGRADLFACGKVIYHMITGDAPRTIRPVSRVRAGLHTGWEELIFRLVEENPRDRFQSADAALAYLDVCERAPAGSRVAPPLRASPTEPEADEEPTEIFRPTEPTVEPSPVQFRIDAIAPDGDPMKPTVRTRVVFEDAAGSQGQARREPPRSITAEQMLPVIPRAIPLTSSEIDRIVSRERPDRNDESIILKTLPAAPIRQPGAHETIDVPRISSADMAATATRVRRFDLACALSVITLVPITMWGLAVLEIAGLKFDPLIEGSAIISSYVAMLVVLVVWVLGHFRREMPHPRTVIAAAIGSQGFALGFALGGLSVFERLTAATGAAGAAIMVAAATAVYLINGERSSGTR